MDFFKNKLLTIVLVLCLVFTIFVGITANKKENTGVIQGVVTSVVTPVQKYIYMAGQRINNVFYYVSSIVSIRKENASLQSEVENLNQKLVDYDNLKRENQELSSMVNLKNSNPNLKLLGANVIGKVGENWFNVIIIDVGKNQGIKKGQYVISGNGLVGQVMEADYTTSKVITILDEKSNIPGKISSTGEDGLVAGLSEASNGNLCKINYLPLETNAKAGDLVVTSNIITDESNLIPSNILIGTITSVEEEKTKLVKAAQIKPAVDFSKLEKVMVVVE
jgi:rod shape-determining protein MreC